VTRSLCIAIAIAAGLALATPARAGEDQSTLSKAKHQMKDAAHDVGEAAKQFGQVVRDDAEEGWSATRRAARKLEREIEKASDEVKAAVKGSRGTPRSESGTRT